MFNTKKIVMSLIMVMMVHFSFAQCIVINEIMIDGGTCDGSCNPNTSEWVELYNTCGTSVDVSCYIISDGDWTFVIPDGTTIPPNGFLTIGGATNEATNPDLYWDDANYSGTGGIGTFTNSAEQLALFDNTGTMIDGIIWGGGQALSANNIPVTSSGPCTVTNVDLPGSSNSDWEDIGSDGVNESTMARECDGSLTWVNMETTDMTFGVSNGCIVMELDTNQVVITPLTEEVEEKVILGVYNILGQEVNLPHYKGIIIVRYSDNTFKKIKLVD